MARRKTSIMRKPCCPQNCTSDKAGLPELCGESSESGRGSREQRLRQARLAAVFTSHGRLACGHETRSVSVGSIGGALTAWRSCLRLLHSVREAAVVERRKEPCLQEEHIWRNYKSIKLGQESQQEVCVHLADLSSRVTRGWWYVDGFVLLDTEHILGCSIKPGGAGP